MKYEIGIVMIISKFRGCILHDCKILGRGKSGRMEEYEMTLFIPPKRRDLRIWEAGWFVEGR